MVMESLAKHDLAYLTFPILTLSMTLIMNILISNLCAKNNDDVCEEGELEDDRNLKKLSNRSPKKNLKTCYPSFPTEPEPFDVFNKQNMTGLSDLDDDLEPKAAPSKGAMKERRQSEIGGAVKSAMPTGRSSVDIKANAKPSKVLSKTALGLKGNKSNARLIKNDDRNATLTTNLKKTKSNVFKNEERAKPVGKTEKQTTRDDLLQREMTAKPSKLLTKTSPPGLQAKKSNALIIKNAERNKTLTTNLKKTKSNVFKNEDKMKPLGKIEKQTARDDQEQKEMLSIFKTCALRKADSKVKLSDPDPLQNGQPKRASAPALLRDEDGDAADPAEITTKQKRPSKVDLKAAN